MTQHSSFARPGLALLRAAQPIGPRWRSVSCTSASGASNPAISVQHGSEAV